MKYEWPEGQNPCHDQERGHYHGELREGELRFYRLRDEEAMFFFRQDNQNTHKVLNEFEDMLNYGKDTTDRSRLRVEYHGMQCYLVGRDTLENRLRFERQGKYVLAYLVHHAQEAIKTHAQWCSIVPEKTLCDLVQYGLTGNTRELIRLLKTLEPAYCSFGTHVTITNMIRDIEQKKDSYRKWEKIIPADRLNRLIEFALSGSIEPLEKELEILRAAYPNEMGALEFRNTLYKVQLRKDEIAEASKHRTEWSDGSDNSVGVRPFDALVYQPAKTQALSELCLHDDVCQAIRIFMSSYRHREELQRANLPWGNRILLAGPPGNGKSALAGALSCELRLPIYFCNMSGIRDAHIGSTSKNVDTAFRGVSNKGAAILFLDECDTIATKRIYTNGADKEDSGALNSVLTNLDRLSPETIVIAATNYPQELDAAFQRRFSSTIWLAPPTTEEALRYVKRYQDEHQIRFFCTPEEQENALAGQPWSKVVEFCQTLHRNQIIGEAEQIPTVWTGRKSTVKKSAIGFRSEIDGA